MGVDKIKTIRLKRRETIPVDAVDPRIATVEEMEKAPYWAYYCSILMQELEIEHAKLIEKYKELQSWSLEFNQLILNNIPPNYHSNDSATFTQYEYHNHTLESFKNLTALTSPTNLADWRVTSFLRMMPASFKEEWAVIQNTSLTITPPPTPWNSHPPPYRAVTIDKDFIKRVEKYILDQSIVEIEQIAWDLLWYGTCRIGPHYVINISVNADAKRACGFLAYLLYHFNPDKYPELKSWHELYLTHIALVGIDFKKLPLISTKTNDIFKKQIEMPCPVFIGTPIEKVLSEVKFIDEFSTEETTEETVPEAFIISEPIDEEEELWKRLVATIKA